MGSAVSEFYRLFVCCFTHWVSNSFYHNSAEYPWLLIGRVKSCSPADSRLLEDVEHLHKVDLEGAVPLLPRSRLGHLVGNSIDLAILRATFRAIFYPIELGTELQCTGLASRTETIIRTKNWVFCHCCQAALPTARFPPAQAELGRHQKLVRKT